MKRRDFLQNSVGLAGLAATPILTDAHKNVTQQIQKSNQDGQTQFDVIVVGVGSMGSATCYYLAKQGVKVLGLEQFDIPHELGSHGGQSRIIRKAYFEHPDYVPLLERAYQNWRELEAHTGASIYTKTGLLYFGKPDHPLMTGMHLSADKYHIKVDSLSNEEVKKKHPQFNIPDGFEKMIEPDAGFVTPERAILLYTQMALQQGAIIKTKEKLSTWKKSAEGIEINTSSGTYTAKKIIFTAGPWTSKLIPGLADQLKVTRQMIAWVKPRNWKLFELGKMACWTIADDVKPGIFYGFPILPVEKFGGPIGLKLAYHYHGPISDPDTINRMPTAEDESILTYVLNKYMPDSYESTHVIKSCMYTNTPDENFILDFVPGYDQDVLIAAGFSGHGFKFASVVGEIMSDLAIKGKTIQPIGFLNAKRFGQ
jgi:sarcosine oxidase